MVTNSPHFPHLRIFQFCFDGWRIFFRSIDVELTVFFLQHLKNIVALSFVLHGLWWDIQCNSNCFSSIGKNVMFLKLLLRCFSFSLVFRILFIMWLCIDFVVVVVYSIWDFSLLLKSIGLFFCQISEFFCHYFFSFFSLTSFSSVLTISLLEPLNRVSGTLFIFFSVCFLFFLFVCLFVFCFVLVFSLLQTG